MARIGKALGRLVGPARVWAALCGLRLAVVRVLCNGTCFASVPYCEFDERFRLQLEMAAPLSARSPILGPQSINALVGAIQGGSHATSRQVRSDSSGSKKTGRNSICSVARWSALRTESPTAQGHQVALANCAKQALPVCRTGKGTPNNGCPEAVSASSALRALSESCSRPRLRDCTPLTDLHLCANKSVDSRLRQLVDWHPTRSSTGNSSKAQGLRTGLSLD